MVNTGKCFIHIKQNRRLCKFEEQNYRNTICNDIYKNINNNPKSFWELLNKLDKSTTRQVSSHEVNSEEFYQFFTNLNKADNNLNEFHEDILKYFMLLKIKLHHSNFLEPEITINEIKTALKKWEKLIYRYDSK